MSFNISVPEELIQDVSDQNVIVSGHSQLVDVSCQHLDVSGNATLDGTLNVSGHSQLVDVSCQHLDVSGTLNVVGDDTSGTIMTITNNVELFDTIVVRRMTNSTSEYLIVMELQLWVNGSNILPTNIGTNNNTAGLALGNNTTFFSNDTNLTISSLSSADASQVCDNNFNEIYPVAGNNSLYIPINTSTNINEVQAITYFNRSNTSNGEFPDVIGLRIELYNRANDPTLSNPLAYTNTISSAAAVYRFDFQSIGTYTGTFATANSTTQIASSTYALTETTIAPRVGLKIENAGLEVGGDTTLDGTLSVGGTLNVGGFPIYNMVSYYNTILSPSNLYHSSVSAQFTYNTLTLTPKSLNSILYISSSGTFEKNGAPYDSYFNIYLNIDGTDIAQIAGAVTYRIAGNARQHVSGSVFYTPNTTNQISITNNVHPAASPTFYIRAYHLNVIEYLI